MTLTITEINAETGESITREMTAEEAANHQEQVGIRQQFLAEQAAAQAAAEAKLAALGLTADDLKALGLG